MDALGDVVSQTFQLERLDRLCSGSVFLRCAFAELIANLNYCMLHDVTDIDGGAAIVIANIRYPINPMGRKAAMAESFRHMANKLDDYMSTTNVRNVLLAMDQVGDIAIAALRGTKVSQNVKAP